MQNEFYYFTGTGNSLANARRIASRIGDTRVVSIPRVLEGEPRPRGDRIGLFFPAYAYGLPRIVKDFVSRANFPKEAYIFAVCSSFGIPGGVLRQLDRLLRKQGVRLHAGFNVLDPRSSLIEDPDNDTVQRVMISLNRGDTPRRSEDRIEEIAAAVRVKQSTRLERSNRLTSFVGGMLNGVAVSSFPTMAESFSTTDACRSCGICARICPRGNIQLEGDRPVWAADCEMCHACIQWCPQEAIQFADRTADKPRYRNAAVSINEMLLR